MPLSPSVPTCLARKLTWSLPGLFIQAHKHDPENHVHPSTEAVKVILSQLALTREQSEKVTAAIKNHLEMSKIILRRDFSDDSVIQQTVGRVLDKVTAAIRFMAGLSLALGIPVLFSAVSATRRERLREGVLLKVLGATRRQVGRIMLAEYLLLGGLGSLVGVVLSAGGAWALMHYVFRQPFTPAIVRSSESRFATFNTSGDQLSATWRATCCRCATSDF